MDDLIELIERDLRGELTAREARRLREWRAANAANERGYGETMRILQAAASLASRGSANRRPPPVASILDRALRSRGGEHEGDARSGAGEPAQVAPPAAGAPGRTTHRAPWRKTRIPAGTPWSRLVPWGVAAAALLVLAIQGVVGSADRGPAGPPVQIVTGPGEMTTVELDDGTVVRLAPSSRLHSTVDGDSRAVRLAGKAFFSVAPDASRPFRVVTGRATATVLGTRFEVVDEGDAFRLLVVEGRVALESPRNRVEVGAGEISFVADDLASQPRPVGAEDPLPDWIGRFLAFRETPLRDVVREVGEVYGVTFRILSPELEDRAVTASFTGQALGEVLEVICTVVHATCASEGAVVTISSP